MIRVLFNKFDFRVALLFAMALLFADPAQAIELRYNDATHSIEMKGKILVGDGMKFSSLLRSHPETENVELSASVGGEYNSSLQMSLEVKKHRLNTVSADYCHSGCAYIWNESVGENV